MVAISSKSLGKTLQEWKLPFSFLITSPREGMSEKDKETEYHASALWLVASR
jgi:hypothetical protein